MKNRIDNILLGLLWLLACTLGTSFWFNVGYGFDIFSKVHWDYLARLQASGNSVNISFYVSFLVAAVIALVGLYILIRPRFRKIVLPINKTSNQIPTIQPTEIAQETTTKNSSIQENASYTENRPPRLNVPKNIKTTPKTTAIQNPTFIAPTKDYSEVKTIFESAGYSVKKDLKINQNKTILFAISPDESVWLGTADISILETQKMIDRLQQTFRDSLEEVEIEIKAFAISPTDNLPNENILTFESVEALKDYISNNHAAPAPTDPDEIDTFNAFSEYIDVVVDFLSKA